MNKEDTRKLIQADYGGISRNVKYTRKELPRCNHSIFIIACLDMISILQKK